MIGLLLRRHTYLKKVICFLFCIGVVSIFFHIPVFGEELNDQTGERGETTFMDPGTAETPEDLRQLNIGINFDNGTGELAGTLRIFIILTLIAIAPILIIMLTSLQGLLLFSILQEMLWELRQLLLIKSYWP